MDIEYKSKKTQKSLIIFYSYLETKCFKILGYPLYNIKYFICFSFCITHILELDPDLFL